MTKPSPNEYPEFYDGYVQSVNDGNISDLMDEQLKSFSELLNYIPTEKHNYRYTEDKWSIKEMLGHINDAERILSHRALAFARCDENDIPQYDHNNYVINGRFDERTFDDLTKEFRFLRKANIILFNSFDEEALNRTGTSSSKSFTVRALGFIIVGHLNHHMKVLNERYL